MSKIIVYYYNKCKRCKNVIDRLRAKGNELELREISKHKLTKEEIRELLKRANMSARDALRKRDKYYKELGLDNEEYNEDQLIELMSRYPSLIARPIVIKEDKVIIGASNEDI